MYDETTKEFDARFCNGSTLGWRGEGVRWRGGYGPLVLCNCTKLGKIAAFSQKEIQEPTPPPTVGKKYFKIDHALFFVLVSLFHIEK